MENPSFKTLGHNKVALKTRIILLITIISFLGIKAQPHQNYQQPANYTLHYKHIKLGDLFKKIEEKSDMYFFYNAKDVDLTQAIAIDISNRPLSELLKIIAKKIQVSYEIKGDQIVLSLLPPAPDKPRTQQKNLQQEITVEGTVTDEHGVPLPGTNVIVKGTQRGTSTDFKGHYTIEAHRNDTLSFSYMGFITQKIIVEDQEDIDVTLIESQSSIAEVLVVYSGYQTISKERSTGSYSKPEMEVVHNRFSSMNVLQRLDGQIPGLTINNSASASENPILIRGLSTIGIPNPDDREEHIGTSRGPLVVVDGVATNDASTVNPQDVEDVTVLKDATAASIWGSRASNGVIVITTKKGRKNQELKVNYDGFVSFKGKPDLHYYPTLNSKQFIQAARDVFDPDTNPWSTVSAYDGMANAGIAPHEQILYDQERGIISENRANAMLDSLSRINNVGQIKDLWYRNAVLTNHTLSLSGGGEKYSFYGSMAYTNDQSNRPGEKDDTYHLNLRQDFDLNKNIHFNLITDLNNRATQAKRPINIDNRFYPYQLFRGSDGNNLSIPYMGYLSEPVREDFEERSGIDLDYNPLDEFNRGYTKNDYLKARVVGGAQINLFKNLEYKGLYAYEQENSKTKSFDSEDSYKVRTEVVQFTEAPSANSTPIYNLPTTGGLYSLTNMGHREWTIRNQLIYNNDWENGSHQLTVMIGQEAREERIRSNNSTVRGYDEELQTHSRIDYKTLGTDGVSNPIMPNGSSTSFLFDDSFREQEIRTRFTSYYGNIGYTLYRKYSVNGSFRIDKSNLFGKDKSAQNKPVWSAGAKWQLGREDFMPKTNWLDDLALRATYGITGNSPAPGTAASFDIYEPQSGDLPNDVGLSLSTPANRKLTWERTQTLNFGLDFSLLHNQMIGTIDFYQKKTDNLLGQLPTNNFTGYSSIIGNFGNLKNRGVEISLKSLNIDRGDFSWNTSFTMAYNKNTITQMNDVAPITTGNTMVQQQYATGFPAFALFAYKYAGLDDEGDPMVYLSDGTQSKDRNITEPDDIVFKGTYQPKWNGGLSNTFRYKNLGLNINMVYNLGHVMRRDVNRFYTGRLSHTNFLFASRNSFMTGSLQDITDEFSDRWKAPGDEASTNIPSYVSDEATSGSRRNIEYYRKADINVISASYIKLRDITLSYSLPKSFIEKLKINDITLRAQLSNVMLWKANHHGIDPEFYDAVTGRRTLKLDQGTLSLGAHVSF